MTEPVPFLNLQLAYQELKEELDRAAAASLASGRYIGGPEVAGFEAAFAAFTGTRHSIGGWQRA